MGRSLLYFLIVIQIYSIWYTFKKPLGSTLIICKKYLQICKSSNNYCNIKLLSNKCAKTKRARKMINYTFVKSPWHGEFKYAKFSKNKFVLKGVIGIIIYFRSFKRFICSQMNSKKFLYNTAISVQPPNIAGHSL